MRAKQRRRPCTERARELHTSRTRVAHKPRLRSDDPDTAKPGEFYLYHVDTTKLNVDGAILISLYQQNHNLPVYVHYDHVSLRRSFPSLFCAARVV